MHHVEYVVLRAESFLMKIWRDIVKRDDMKKYTARDAIRADIEKNMGLLPQPFLNALKSSGLDPFTFLFEAMIELRSKIRRIPNIFTFDRIHEGVIQMQFLRSMMRDTVRMLYLERLVDMSSLDKSESEGPPSGPPSGPESGPPSGPPSGQGKEEMQEPIYYSEEKRQLSQIPDDLSDTPSFMQLK